MRMLSWRLLIAFFCLLPITGWGSMEELMRDLVTVRAIDKRLNERMPVIYNHLSEGGYIVLPSARAGSDGSVSMAYASIPPYTIYGARLQFLERLEVVGNYRIFNGVPDPVLTQFGFGDFSDKGANVKVVLWRPEDSDYQLPGLAVGAQDFLGTKQFEGQYIVATQVIPQYDLEMSLGVGFGRIGGIYGGILWMPFRGWESEFLQGVTAIVEFDPTNYEDPTKEAHPDGRVKKSPVNFGVQYRLWGVDLAASYIRGDAFAFSVMGSVPLGTTKGAFTKSKEDPIYRRPVNRHPISASRPGEALMHELAIALEDQHLQLMEGWLSTGEGGAPMVWLRVVNERYRYEQQVWDRLTQLLAALIPSNVEEVRVVIDNHGVPVHEYRYPMDAVRGFREGRMGIHELLVHTHKQNPTRPPKNGIHLFSSSRALVDWDLKPRTNTFFGSSRGKFKYSLGVDLGLDGYLWGDIYYKLIVGKVLVSDLGDVNDIDMLNPSRIINVRSDAIRYQQSDGLILDRAYLQKSWHLYNGLYGRIAAGYFEEAYAGVGAELLYSPYGKWWAIGIEGAYLKKREYQGFGFTDTVRLLDPPNPSTLVEFHPNQGFLNLYYDIVPAGIELKVSAGRFLAKDWGARFEVKRVFESGFEVSFWYTRTNGRDVVNGERYYDKGVSVSVPLDIMFENSSKERWAYGLSAWLRDVGARSNMGRSLYDIIKEERR